MSPGKEEDKGGRQRGRHEAIHREKNSGDPAGSHRRPSRTEEPNMGAGRDRNTGRAPRPTRKGRGNSKNQTDREEKKEKGVISCPRDYP